MLVTISRSPQSTRAHEHYFSSLNGPTDKGTILSASEVKPTREAEGAAYLPNVYRAVRNRLTERPEVVYFF